jgi:hypothetical protein
LSDFIGDSGPIIAVFVGIGILGGYMYQIGKWINKKADEKANVLKIQTEEYARNLKKQTEDYAENLKTNQQLIADAIAKVALDTAGSVAKVATDTALTLKENNEKIAVGLKQNNESIATDLKNHNERIATGLKDNNERIAISLRDNNEHTSITLKALLNESTDKLNQLLTNLRERADLTNGNVAAIRLDVQDLKEDLQTRDDIDQEERDLNSGRYYSDDGQKRRTAVKRSKVTRNRDDANKRRGIETDRRAQHGAGYDSHL